VVRQKNRQVHVGEVDIAVAKPYREEGIGLILFNIMILEAKRIGLKLLRLYCYENNPRAIHVYEKIGFHKVGVIPEAILYKGTYVGQVIMYLSLV
jgi:RimJ/RimL family protein N-acetyltransferase